MVSDSGIIDRKSNKTVEATPLRFVPHLDRSAEKKMPSYSVKCHFEWSPKKAKTLAHLYEERITLWQAATIEDAIEAAEREAFAYAAHHGFTFIKLSQAFWMFIDLEADGIELFSLLRESDLESSAYLDHYHDTGLERESKQAEQDGGGNSAALRASP